MLTLQQIRDVVFEKKMSGYKMSEVDDFIDACAETVQELTAERDELNRKLELLKQSMETMIARTKENLMTEIEGINKHVEMGMNAILAFTEEAENNNSL